jgi:hypothetical protein
MIMSSFARQASPIEVNVTGNPELVDAIDAIENGSSPRDLFVGKPSVITLGPLMNTGVLKVIDFLNPWAI